MADEPAEEQTKRTKRRLRPATETVRERNKRIETKQEARILKDAEPSKPNAFKTFVGGFTWPLRKLGRAIASLGRFKFFRGLGRVFYPRYFRNSWKELRLVTWPSRKTSWKLTYAVIIFSVLFGVIVAIVDFGLDKLFKEFIIK